MYSLHNGTFSVTGRETNVIPPLPGVYWLSHTLRIQCSGFEHTALVTDICNSAFSLLKSPKELYLKDHCPLLLLGEELKASALLQGKNQAYHTHICYREGTKNCNKVKAELTFFIFVMMRKLHTIYISYSEVKL